MANNTREVTLGINVGVTGEGEVTSLAAAVRALGKEGDPAAAGFTQLAAELERTTAATEANRQAEADARAEAVAARAALGEQRDALSKLRIETEASARSTDAYRDAEQQQKLAILAAQTALREKSAALAAASAETKAAVAAESAMQAELRALVTQYRTTATAASATSRAQVEGNTAVGASVELLSAQLKALRDLAGLALGGSIIGSLANDLGKTADQYANLSARIRIATGDGAAFTQSLQGVFDIAQRTGSAVDDVGHLYTKLLTAGKALSLSNADALRLTETITQAVALGGETAESANAAIVQFSQGLAAGVLRGEDLNSVLEQAPRLAKAFADGLGVTTGELKRLGETGALTSAQVIGALKGQAAALNTEFAQLPATIGRSIQQLSNAWTAYIGEADKASGASATVAAAISAVARNLDTLGTLLYSAGKAALAYQAVKLAATFLEVGTSASVATVAIASNTAALTANAVAGAEAAASTGRFASLLGSLKLGGLVLVLTNLRTIGTAIGEGAAKLAGYGKAIDDLERSQRADEVAARAMAATTAQLAQQMQLAADKAFGVTAQSQKLVGEFNDVVLKGGEATEALEKLTKALDLGSLEGVKNAGIALDALGQKGTLTGGQIRDSLAAALNGRDLQIFKTEAMAAFDGSEQGARRLAAAIDATMIEALRRAGTSVDELKTGFTRASTSAINDLDVLADSLRSLGVTGADAGRVLETSLNKALDAAATTRAIDAVRERIEALGAAGLLSGDQLAAGLQKARDRADALLPGINSLSEALHTFGLQSVESAAALATKMGEAYATIAQSAKVSLADQRAAFDAWSKAATEANAGVEPSAVHLARVMLEIKEAAQTAGAGVVDAMGRAKASAVDAANAIHEAVSLSSSFEAANAKTKADSNASNAARQQFNSTPIDDSVRQGLVDRKAAGTLTTADLAAAQSNLQAQKNNYTLASTSTPGMFSLEGQQDALAQYRLAQSILTQVTELARKSAAPAPASSTSSSTHNVNITVNGKTTSVNTASAADGSNLATVLSQLESAARSGGY